MGHGAKINRHMANIFGTWGKHFWTWGENSGTRGEMFWDRGRKFVMPAVIEKIGAKPFFSHSPDIL